MASLFDLANNIQGSISGLIDDITGKTNSVVGYPTTSEVQGIQSTIIPGNWAKLSFPYTFSVLNIKTGTQASEFKDFELPLAPQSINQSEEPAINVRATQGGTTVNHGGLGYKTLNISGTTGIAPFRGDGGVRLKTGEAIFQPKQLKYKSGYEVFLHLRNWFRTYYEFKKKNASNSNTPNYRLVWKNYKDGEFLIVELLTFEMERNASKPFMYDYKLSFKVLSHYQFTAPGANSGFLADVDSLISNVEDKIDTARGVMLRTQGILRQVESTYDATVLEPLRKATLAIKALLGIPLVAADIGSRIVANTISTAKALVMVNALSSTTSSYASQGNTQALAKSNSLTDSSKGSLKQQLSSVTKDVEQRGSAALLGLGALINEIDIGSFPPQALSQAADEQAKASTLPRSFFTDTISNLDRVKANLEDFVNLGSTSSDGIFDRTATLSADPSRTVTDDEYDLLNAFNEASVALWLLLSTDAMFKSSYDERIADMNSRFNNQISLQAQQAVRQMTLPAGVTLERLALQELGDPQRWGEIVEVNNLKAPYVSDDPQESRDGVLKAGSTILIPTAVIDGFSDAPNGAENKLSVKYSELEKSLGIDLKVDENFDLVLSSSGDLEIVGGAENMAQAVILRLSYEPGEVMDAPNLGGGTIPGEKFPPLEQIKDRITTTLLQDPRVEKIVGLSLNRDGGALSIDFNLFIKNVDIPVPVKIKV